MLTWNSEKRVSHPMGTTVSITDFLKTVPVRRQSAIKEKSSALQLAKIKRTLQSYALARPCIRFSLKVLKAKTDKSNWTYAPKHSVPGESQTTASTIDAVTKIFGKTLIDQCQWVSWTALDERCDMGPSRSEKPESECAEENGYRFEALLPLANKFDFSPVTIPRQFVSIDARPVSCLRGTVKEIVSRFKRSFKSAASASDNENFVDPFLCLNIICPQGSYDANIEPAKDAVLFDNPELVLTLADKLFRNFYRIPNIATIPCTSLPTAPKTQGFDLLLAKKPPIVLPSSMVQHTLQARRRRSAELRASESLDTSPSLSGRSPDPTFGIINGHNRPSHKSTVGRASMYDDSDDGDVQTTSSCNKPYLMDINQDEDSDAAINDINTINPWAIAKFNACLRQPGGQRSDDIETSVTGQLPTPGRQCGDISISLIPSSDEAQYIQDHQTASLRTPERSDRQPFVDPDSASPPPFPFPQRARSKRLTGEVSTIRGSDDRKINGNGALDNWVKRSQLTSADSSSFEANLHRHTSHEQQMPRFNDFVSARTLPKGTVLSDIPDISQISRRKQGARKQKIDALKKSFVSPVNDPGRVWFKTGEHQPKRQQQHLHPSNASSNTREATAFNLRDDESGLAETQNEPSKTIHPDLAITLDYEARKLKAAKDYRSNERQQALETQRALRLAAQPTRNTLTTPPPSSSPHQNRYLKAIAALQPAIKDPNSITRTPHSFKPNDPRAFLVHEQAREETANPKSRTSKRARTSLLPLETTREKDSVREVSLSLSLKEEDIEEHMLKVAMHDTYITRVDLTKGLSQPSAKNIEAWQTRLKMLVAGLYAREGTSRIQLDEGGMRIDLTSAFAEHARFEDV